MATGDCFQSSSTVTLKQRTACSLGLSATSQQYFSLRTNQPPATSQQYFSLRTNQHQPSATSQPNRLGFLQLAVAVACVGIILEAGVIAGVVSQTTKFEDFLSRLGLCCALSLTRSRRLVQ
jgi:hypothetical protein